jgi:hypothetical protein
MFAAGLPCVQQPLLRHGVLSCECVYTRCVCRLKRETERIKREIEQREMEEALALVKASGKGKGVKIKVCASYLTWLSSPCTPLFRLCFRWFKPMRQAVCSDALF